VTTSTVPLSGKPSSKAEVASPCSAWTGCSRVSLHPTRPRPASMTTRTTPEQALVKSDKEEETQPERSA
jgi:hypothetical protein